MKTPKMQEHKLIRAIKRYGVMYNFVRDKRDSRNEPELDAEGKRIPVLVCSIKGIFHEQGDFYVSMIQEDTAVRTEPLPMIMCMKEKVLEDLIQVSDYVVIDNCRYDFVALRNVNHFNLFVNISLELVDNGRNSLV